MEHSTEESDLYNEFRERIREAILRRLEALSSEGHQLSQSQIQDLVYNLPRLTEKQVTDLGHKDSMCPICLTPFSTLLAEEEMAIAMDSPALPIEELGVARLSQEWQCGHLFCRRDITRWIQDSHDSCPMCRQALMRRSEGESPPPPFPGPLQDGVNGLNVDPDHLPPEIQELLVHMNARGPSGSFVPMFIPPSNTDVGRDDRDEYAGMYS
ncbi:uncharacterized protein BT62DRAFT_677601 [Guyanagaster necrorhizus]|uniref:RING-type domain-containing protein n=1 Tax=Guyanagaster necrorhizus TaxID=856835 RepID=A0A9P7VZC6_9AGAR|nr:uncharacterized protein BT62DRAFT_677601 [Guyanagaster necrorhizus MCA 3950]KAG7449322.1 hypothetical protein BT62DRAFT_677601 [Guyanagaster necrorhizus MCA 3950]